MNESKSSGEAQRLARARELGMEAELRAFEEDPPLCASCETPAPSPISDEAGHWTRRRFTIPEANVAIELTLCPACSAQGTGPRVVVDRIAVDALRVAGCTCDPLITVDGADLATGHDDGCSLLRHARGV